MESHTSYTHKPTNNAQRAGAGRTESNRRGAATNRACNHCALHTHRNSDMSRATMYVTIASAAGYKTSDVSTIIDVPPTS